jgi:hypothetical protein
MKDPSDECDEIIGKIQYEKRPSWFKRKLASWHRSRNSDPLPFSPHVHEYDPGHGQIPLQTRTELGEYPPQPHPHPQSSPILAPDAHSDSDFDSASTTSPRHVPHVMITEKEINDKSKGDGLAKAFVMIQTAWFAIQFVARAVMRLAITKLEVFTLAFAMMNFVVYIFWWNKPYNVETPLEVTKYEKEKEEEFTPYVKNLREKSMKPGANVVGGSENAFTNCIRITNLGPYVTKDSLRLLLRDCGSIKRIKIHQNPTGWHEASIEFLLISSVTPAIQKFNATNYHGRRINVCCASFDETGFNPKIGWFMKLIQYTILQMVDMAADIDEDDSDGVHLAVDRNSERVNVFATGELEKGEGKRAALVTAFLAIFVGALHCVAWNFSFPSKGEEKAWKICSVAITAIPIIFSLMTIPGIVAHPGEDDDDMPRQVESGWKSYLKAPLRALVACFGSIPGIGAISFLFGILMIIGYCIARFVLLVIAFSSLRSLPPSTLQDVPWSDFIPHIA